MIGEYINGDYIIGEYIIANHSNRNVGIAKA